MHLLKCLILVLTNPSTCLSLFEGSISYYLLERNLVLNFDEKYQLWKLLEDQIGQREEELMEKDEAIQTQIKNMFMGGCGSRQLRQ